MSCHYYNFYGFNVKIDSTELSIDELNFCRDFVFFKDAAKNTIDLHIQIIFKQAHAAYGIYLGKTRMCRVFQRSYSKREYEYIKNNIIVGHAEKSMQRFILTSNNVSVINEILYFFILSAVGENFDCRGIMRIHALSYFTKNQATIVYGKEGAGKSTLAHKLMSDANYQIYSDEMTLIDINSGSILPFPMRVGIKTPSVTSFRHSYFFDSKQMYEIATIQIAKPSDVINLTYLESSTHELIRTVPKLKLFKISTEIILGIGLAQMSEYLLRPDNIHNLFKILWNRIKLIYFLMYSTKV